MLLLLPLLGSFTSAHAQQGNAYGQYDVGETIGFTPLPAGLHWPEGIIADYDRDLVYVTGPAAHLTAGGDPPWIQIGHLENGQITNWITTLRVTGLDTSIDYALVEGSHDADGNVYVNYINGLESGVFKFTRGGYPSNYSWAQSTHTAAPFPIIVTVPEGLPVPPTLPNGNVIAPNNDMYVPDSVQGILFRIPADSRIPEPAYIDPTLGFYGGGRMGINGIKFDPDREYLYVSFVGGDPDGPGPMLGANGTILRFVAADIEAGPELVYTYGIHDIPDGLAFTHKGDLVVVLAGDHEPSSVSGLSVLSNLEGTATEVAFYPIDGVSSKVQASTIVLDPHGKVAHIVDHALDSVPPNPFGPPAVPTPNPFGVYSMFFGERGDSLP